MLDTPDVAPRDEADNADLAALRAELARERTSENAGLVAVILFGIFLLRGLSQGSVQSLIVLVVVLFFHEAGHAFGMLTFGYRDVRIFFLPFIGAAVMGRKDDAAAWQRAVVLLLGPTPGVILGLVLLGVSHGQGLLGELGRMAVYLNLFNLLPFEPLDGGRLLGVTLFSRSRWLEAIFGLLGALALTLLAIKIGAIALVVVALLATLGVRRRWQIASAARELKARGLTADAPPASLPSATLAAIDDAGLRIQRPTNNIYVVRSNLVREIHARLRFSPPGLGATLALLTAYGAAVLLGLVALVVAARTHATPDKPVAALSP